nr:4'-phosphopantetheinyl transferase superfamily protein [Saprospiraceae bacterium]
MPIIYKEEVLETVNTAVWKIEEPEHYYLGQLSLSPDNEKELAGIVHPSKRLQFLASRLLLQQMVPDGKSIHLKRSEYRKPFLPSSNIHLTVSHSGPFAAVAVSRRSVGIDIQEFDHRLVRLSQKFVGNKEREYINSKTNHLDYYHVIWGAKESVFKAYEKGRLDFKEHIEVAEFS